MENKFSITLGILIATVFLFSPDLAYAENPFTEFFGNAPETDYSLIMLARIFPSMFGDDVAGKTLAITHAFATFNAGLLVLGASMIGFHLILGVVNTAHEGMALGKNWHQIWAPIRVVGGIASLAPVAGGFCIAQLLVIQIATWGVGFADKVWGTYVDQIAEGAVVTANTIPASFDLIKGVVLMEACYDYAKRNYYDPAQWAIKSEMVVNDTGTSPILFVKDYPSAGIVKRIHGSSIKNYTWNYGAVCGSMTSKFLGDLNEFYTQPIEAKSGSITEMWRLFHPSETKYRGRNKDGWKSPFHSYQKDYLKRRRNKFPDETDAEKESFYKQEFNNFNSQRTQRMQLTETQRIQRAENAKNPTENAKNTEIHAAAVAFDKARYNALVQVIARVRKEIVHPMINKVKIREDNAVNKTSGGSKVSSSVFNHDFKKIVFQIQQEYTTTLFEQARSFALEAETIEREAFQKEAKAGGWITAGTWYLKISNLSGTVITKANKTPKFNKGNVKELTVGSTRNVEETAFTGFLLAVDREWRDSIKSDIGFSDLALKSITGDNEENDLTGAINDWGIGIVANFADLDINNPMGSMITFGHKTLIIAEAGVIAIAFLSAGTALGDNTWSELIGLKSITNFIFKFIAFLTPFIYMILIAMLTIGATHAYLLPMMPYIIWTIAIVGWIAFILEAMVAAPLWALMHCRMDGQGLIDQVQKPGYMLAFNLFLRPVLMVFGLLLSFSAYGILIGYVNKTAISTVKVAVDNDGFGIVGILVMIGIVTYLHYQIIMKTFSLIHMVPDRVSRWFGQGGEQLGEEQDAKSASGIIMTGFNKSEMVTQGAMTAGKAQGKETPGGKTPGGDGGKKPDGPGDNRE